MDTASIIQGIQGLDTISAVQWLAWHVFGPWLLGALLLTFLVWVLASAKSVGTKRWQVLTAATFGTLILIFLGILVGLPAYIQLG